ncbi:hypothetical protein BofuT4_P139790.1 [Botrytis cinerea T4]|uniref:Uncharacterized protein n=1 Tax=Botryotinia fuckeliana (strain T4) TaxID=999810 RepID=G2YN57_BOTF4|nr:hypothetical protein BofuT4_P139790.1 [Botrytis cinerea T4]
MQLFCCFCADRHLADRLTHTCIRRQSTASRQVIRSPLSIAGIGIGSYLSPTHHGPCQIEFLRGSCSWHINASLLNPIRSPDADIIDAEKRLGLVISYLTTQLATVDTNPSPSPSPSRTHVAATSATVEPAEPTTRILEQIT